MTVSVGPLGAQILADRPRSKRLFGKTPPNHKRDRVRLGFDTARVPCGRGRRRLTRPWAQITNHEGPVKVSAHWRARRCLWRSGPRGNWGAIALSVVPTTKSHQVAWVRPPRQTRSQETLERILDAAEAVVSEKGFESATIAEIVAQAQSSIGAFYARFRDKESLLGCLHERFCEEAMATADAALDPAQWQDASVAEILQELLPFLIGTYRLRRGLLRAFLVQAGNDPSFADKAVRLGDHVALRVRELLLTRQHDLRHPEPALAVDLGLRVILGVLDGTTLFPKTEQTELLHNDELLAQELTRLYLRYLGVPEPG